MEKKEIWMGLSYIYIYSKIILYRRNTRFKYIVGFEWKNTTKNWKSVLEFFLFEENLEK